MLTVNERVGMREIKFRAWVTHEHFDKLSSFMLNDGDWYETRIGFADSGGDKLLVGSSGVYLKSMYDNSAPYKLNAIAMQSTGLKDKNGVEIYENDIVTTDYPTVKNMADAWLVEYGHTGMFQMAVGSFKQSIHELVYNDWKLEVIGNIYENPELLK